MKKILISFFLLFAPLWLIFSKKAPNFIIIYSDDLGYTQTSVPMMKERPELGHSLHKTPNLEKLAEQGMRFSNAYCPSPVCTSSRASIQFGMTTARVGCISIHDVVMNKRQVDFKKKVSLAEMLKESGKDYISVFFLVRAVRHSVGLRIMGTTRLISFTSTRMVMLMETGGNRQTKPSSHWMIQNGFSAWPELPMNSSKKELRIRNPFFSRFRIMPCMCGICH